MRWVISIALFVGSATATAGERSAFVVRSVTTDGVQVTVKIAWTHRGPSRRAQFFAHYEPPEHSSKGVRGGLELGEFTMKGGSGTHAFSVSADSLARRYGLGRKGVLYVAATWPGINHHWGTGWGPRWNTSTHRAIRQLRGCAPAIFANGAEPLALPLKDNTTALPLCDGEILLVKLPKPAWREDWLVSAPGYRTKVLSSSYRPSVGQVIAISLEGPQRARATAKPRALTLRFDRRTSSLAPKPGVQETRWLRAQVGGPAR
ncbi:MAG: hypothetical protein H6707_09180 [Deltaproteobacteria bacterium]|nr:hypothetical protein [Deltaproteobacteria bacterium]